MTNTINTLENLNKLASKMVKVQKIARKDAERVAEFMLQFTDTQKISVLLSRIN
jgi:hypothetical protein